jgi:hypothetical protein
VKEQSATQSTPSTKLGAALVILLVLAACAPQPSLTPGAYVSSLTSEDTTSYIFIADWQLTLAEDNGYSLSKDGDFWEQGSYNMTQDQITFTMSEGKYPCGATGTYTWASDGNGLALTTVEDTCEGRPMIFTTHPWSPTG